MKEKELLKEIYSCVNNYLEKTRTRLSKENFEAFEIARKIKEIFQKHHCKHENKGDM